MKLLSQKICAWFRFVIVKFFFNNVFMNSLVYIGRDCTVEAGKGVVTFNGRAHLSDHTEIKTTNGKIEIGHQVSIQKYSRVVSRESIVLGDNIKIARFVTIIDHDHVVDRNGSKLFNEYKTDKILIGSNVWIGDKVTILKGVTIGSNVVIGANSLVNKNIPSNTINGGIPCKILKKME